MSGRLTSFSFTFRISKDERETKKGVIEQVEREVNREIETQLDVSGRRTPTSSAQSSSRNSSDLLDLMVKVSVLLYFADGSHKMQKRIETEGAQSETLRSVLRRVVSKSGTLQRKKFHEGRLFQSQNKASDSLAELECGLFGEKLVKDVAKSDEMFLVFDMCEFNKRPDVPGAKWTICVDDEIF